eukprot:1905931-Amphidinium_carterae.1
MAKSTKRNELMTSWAHCRQSSIKSRMETATALLNCTRTFVALTMLTTHPQSLCSSTPAQEAPRTHSHVDNGHKNVKGVQTERNTSTSQHGCRLKRVNTARSGGDSCFWTILGDRMIGTRLYNQSRLLAGWNGKSYQFATRTQIIEKP